MLKKKFFSKRRLLHAYANLLVVFIVLIILKYFSGHPILFFGAGKFKLGLARSKVGRGDLDSRRGGGYDSVLFELLWYSH